MEIKKNPKIDLDRKSGMFFNIGLTISLALTLVAFEWKSNDDMGMVNLGISEETFEDIMEIPPTEQPPPPPPRMELPRIIEVADELEIEQNIEVNLDVEVSETSVVQEIVFETAPVEEVAEEIFDIVEEPAAPIGGMSEFYAFVRDNMEYPSQARRMGVEGRVFVQFVVDHNGHITEVKAIKGIGAGCDEEAVRVISKLPKWKPGKQRGRAVKQRMILPITFKLS